MKSIGWKIFGGLLTLSASMALAATNACPTSNGAWLPSAGSASNVNLITSPNFPTPAAPGGQGNCTAIDLTFSNFTTSSNLSTTAYVYQGQIGISGGDPSANPLFLTFATERGAHNAGNGNNDDGTNEFSDN